MAAEQTGNMFLTTPLIPYIAIFFIFYFLMIKPQKDKQKQMKNMIDNLKKNDRVVTVAGIHGTIALIKEKTVIVRVDDNVKLEMDKESITGVIK
ncbi:MAG: preprotein translocase subunit YajC [Candidatus Omnitrophica bacterium]|nr:preprotein translocase subunit YajC [Candidatus Omnitrophota bacterium]